MSKNLSEPGINKSAAANEWNTRQLLRRPAPPAGTAPETAWIAAYDNYFYGQTVNSSASATNIQFPFIDWSDNAAGIFDYVRSASTIGATNNYNPILVADGIYAFSIYLRASNMGASNYEVLYTLDTNTYYPGRNSPAIYIEDRIYTTADFQDAAGTARSYSSPDFDFQRTVILPCETVGGPGTVYPAIDIVKPGTAANFDFTFDSRFWITYLGPLNHAATVNGSNDPHPTHP